MMIRNILWDFDGTLFDTYPTIAGAYAAALAEWKVSSPGDDIDRKSHRS